VENKRLARHFGNEVWPGIKSPRGPFELHGRFLPIYHGLLGTNPARLRDTLGCLRLRTNAIGEVRRERAVGEGGPDFRKTLRELARTFAARELLPLLRKNRTGVNRFGQFMQRHPGDRITGQNRTRDRGRTTPTGQKGRVDVQSVSRQSL
jgi:hypothetical protein